MAEAEKEIAEDNLSPRQRAFVEEFLVDLNATRACIRAGYSPVSARQQGALLMTYPAVADAVAVEQQLRSKRTGVTADRVLQELALLAFSDLGDVVEDGEGGTVKIRQLAGMPISARRSIESVKSKATQFGVELSVKLHSKTAALKMLADHLGMAAPVKLEVKDAGDEEGDVGKMSIEQLEAKLAEIAARPAEGVE